MRRPNRAMVIAIAGAITLTTAAGAQEAPPSPMDDEAAMSGVVWDSGSVRLEADDFELRVGDKIFYGIGPTAVDSDPGGSDYRTLEITWQEQGVEQRMNLYFGADDDEWWISEIRTYDGFEQGEWLNYAVVGQMWNDMLRTPKRDTYEGDVQLVGWGRVPGEVRIKGLRLTPFAPGTGPASFTGCEFAVSPENAERTRPADKGQPLYRSGYKKMSPQEVEAMLLDLGLCFDFRYGYPTGPWIDGGQEGMSERWCTAPPSGKVDDALYGSEGQIIIFVEDRMIREAREQPLQGWNCPPDEWPGDLAAADPAAVPSLPPLAPLGAVRGGGRIEMPASGFEMTFPDDWIVEVADPDPDVSVAAPGDAWEALRAHDPERLQACSVSVGVATVSLSEGAGGASGEVTMQPRWDERDESMLWAPGPRVQAGSGGLYSVMAPRERLHDGDAGLAHDVLYVVSCSAAGDDQYETAESALEGLIDSFEFLPSRS